MKPRTAYKPKAEKLTELVQFRVNKKDLKAMGKRPNAYARDALYARMTEEGKGEK